MNGKEIARQSVVSNDYGSVSGSFTAPRDRLMGRMMLHVDQVQGNSWINVEEYKRPKFQVTLDAPKAAPRLGDEVEMQGKAMAYTKSRRSAGPKSAIASSARSAIPTGGTGASPGA